MDDPDTGSPPRPTVSTDTRLAATDLPSFVSDATGLADASATAAQNRAGRTLRSHVTGGGRGLVAGRLVPDRPAPEPRCRGRDDTRRDDRRGVGAIHRHPGTSTGVRHSRTDRDVRCAAGPDRVPPTRRRPPGGRRWSPPPAPSPTPGTPARGVSGLSVGSTSSGAGTGSGGSMWQPWVADGPVPGRPGPRRPQVRPQGRAAVRWRRHRPADGRGRADPGAGRRSRRRRPDHHDPSRRGELPGRRRHLHRGGVRPRKHHLRQGVHQRGGDDREPRSGTSSTNKARACTGKQLPPLRAGVDAGSARGRVLRRGDRRDRTWTRRRSSPGCRRRAG